MEIIPAFLASSPTCATQLLNPPRLVAPAAHSSMRCLTLQPLENTLSGTPLLIPPMDMVAPTAEFGHASESSGTRSVSASGYQPISRISESDKSLGPFTVATRSPLMKGSINWLGVSLTSQCETDEPGAMTVGA